MRICPTDNEGKDSTWEHDCHLFLKRALLNEMRAATPEQYRGPDYPLYDAGDVRRTGD